MPGQPEEPKQAPQDSEALAETQEKLNESVATGEDEVDDQTANRGSFPASDPPSTY